ncbi:MAG TPA: cephalosporin hydroxylase [Candidatus Scalindua sp.]|nr:cephalosporin hydroxylase [Candidatus Scalindua sp.]
MGVCLSKCPLDAWIYQEIIWEIRPEVIIETGTAQGGSALFFASLCDLLKKGEVITIDIVDDCNVSHSRMHRIIGDCLSNEVISKIKKIAGNKSAMVILDSAHNREHVLKEMELYSEFVSIGNYMVVEDTNLSGHPVRPSWEGGPMEAVEKFMRNRKDFEIDRTREKFYLTFYPKGFLRRIKSKTKNAFT